MMVNDLKNSKIIRFDIFFFKGSNHNTRRQKRRRPTDSGLSDEYEQKRQNPSSISSFSRRLSASSTRSVCLSSSEDEPGTSIHQQEINKNKTNIIETPIHQPSSQSQRKRHQRKPIRLSNGNNQQQQQQQLNISIKNESSISDDNHSMMRKKLANSPNENFQWIHQAFRSMVPPTDIDLTIQQNSTSSQPSKIIYFNQNLNLTFLFI